MATSATKMPNESDAERRRRLRAECRVLTSVAVALRQIAAGTATGDRTEALRGLDVPTLVIHGRLDPLIDLSGGEATAAAIPGADLLVLGRMGHDLPRLYWPQIADATLALTSR